MDAPAALPKTKIKRWLPYWAVFQADLHQTLHSWVYRVWVLVSVLAAGGYLLYRIGIAKEAGLVQHASAMIGDLLHWTVLGSVTLIVVLTGGSISSEHGTLADSVLSRGISRYQYFFGKWHARLLMVLSTFLIMGFVAVLGSFFFLHQDLSWRGGLVALATITALLAAVTTCGVTVSAMSNSTILGITLLWIFLYGLGFVLSLLPGRHLSPERLLVALPNILQGYYDLSAHLEVITWSLLFSLLAALVGLRSFATRDV